MEWPWQAKAFPNELSLRSCKSLKLLWLYLLCFCVCKFSILEGFVGFFFSGACKLQLPAVWLLNHGPAHEGVLHQLSHFLGRSLEFCSFLYSCRDILGAVQCQPLFLFSFLALPNCQSCPSPRQDRNNHLCTERLRHWVCYLFFTSSIALIAQVDVADQGGLLGADLYWLGAGGCHCQRQRI